MTIHQIGVEAFVEFIISTIHRGIFIVCMFLTEYSIIVSSLSIMSVMIVVSPLADVALVVSENMSLNITAIYSGWTHACTISLRSS